MTIRITRNGRGFKLSASQSIARPRDDVFRFFADHRNLDKLTPATLRFHVLTPDPVEMKPGAVIDYRLRIHGWPVRWRSEITAWDPPLRFVDEQRRGPYRWWRHEHLFEEVGGGTRVEDRVTYGVPGGRVVHALLVRRDLERIFRYRQGRLAELLKD